MNLCSKSPKRATSLSWGPMPAVTPSASKTRWKFTRIPWRRRLRSSPVRDPPEFGTRTSPRLPSILHVFLASHFPKTCFLARPVRGPGRLLGAVRRTRLRRYHAPAANGPLLLDFGTAGFPHGVPGIRRAWPRRQALRLVRHRTTPPARALRRCRHLHSKASDFSGLWQRHRSDGAQHFRHLHGQHPDQHPDRAHLLSAADPAGLPPSGGDRRRSRASVLDHSPPLHTKHDGEQLHPAAVVDWLCLPVSVAAQRQSPGAGDRLGRVRIEPAHKTDDWTRPHCRSNFSVADPVV